MKKMGFWFCIALVCSLGYSFYVQAVVPPEVAEMYTTLKMHVNDIRHVSMRLMSQRVEATREIKGIINAEREKITVLYNKGVMTKDECYFYMSRYVILYRKINDWIFGR